MAVTIRQTLVLRGVSVVRDVVTGRTGLDRASAKTQTPALAFSMRHLSHRFPEAGYAPEQQPLAANNRSKRAVRRAGRSGSCPGVPSFRMPALRAGRATPRWWSRAAGTPCSTVLLCRGGKARPGSFDQAFRGRPRVVGALGLGNGMSPRQAANAPTLQAGFGPAGGTPAAARRGEGA